MKSCPSLKLSKDSILWACSHLSKFGDTDLLPIPFEYNAIRASLRQLSEKIEKIDLAEHPFEVPRKISVPKVRGGYRIASQLTPLDSIIYTSLAYSVSSSVENQRIPEERNQSCSYRVKSDASGRFFADDEGYSNYKTAIIEAIEDDNISHVLTLDLSDFYGQISHHRIQNNLEASGISNDESKVIEHTLGCFNSNQHSQGIPIGPSGSIILAEAAMIDVDDFLARGGYRFCRYVDDFRIFFQSKASADTALRKLTELLHNNHRLPINSNKTAIWSKRDFGEKEFIDEEKLERERKEEALKMLKDVCIGTSRPSFTASPSDENFAARNAVEDLFERVESEEPLPLGLARFVLRRARLLRTNKIIDRIIPNIKKFLPVLRDVVFYFDTIDKNGKNGKYHELIDSLHVRDITGSLPFAQEWCAYALFKNDLYDSLEDYLDILKGFESPIQNRFKPMIAAKVGAWGVVREFKEQIDGFNSASKRAIVLASCVLPDDEKKHWLGSHIKSNDPIISACAVYAKANKSLEATA